MVGPRERRRPVLEATRGVLFVAALSLAVIAAGALIAGAFTWVF